MTIFKLESSFYTRPRGDDYINEILQSYVPLVDFLANILGDNAEVVLHDITDINCSVVAISNGHISNRDVGAPATNKALRFIKDPIFQDKDYSLNYKGKSSKDKFLKSSTFFIKGSDKKIVGLLCINVDYEKFLQIRNFIDDLIRMPQSEDTSDTDFEFFTNSVEELAFESIEKTIQSFGVPPERMSAEEKTYVIKVLNENCVFLLKGAIPRVAKYLKVSEPTIYRYLNKIKSSEE